MSIEQELNRAYWAAEDKRLEPLVEFIASLPGVVEVEGSFMEGSLPRERMAESLRIPIEEVPVDPEDWTVIINFEQTDAGWETLGVLAGALRGGKAHFGVYAPCPCCNPNVWESLRFWIDSTEAPEVVTQDLKDVIEPLRPKPRGDGPREYVVEPENLPAAVEAIVGLYKHLHAQLPVVESMLRTCAAQAAAGERMKEYEATAQALGELFDAVDSFIVCERDTIRDAYGEALTNEEIAELEEEGDDGHWVCTVEFAETAAEPFAEAVRNRRPQSVTNRGRFGAPRRTNDHHQRAGSGSGREPPHGA